MLSAALLALLLVDQTPLDRPHLYSVLEIVDGQLDLLSQVFSDRSRARRQPAIIHRYPNGLILALEQILNLAADGEHLPSLIGAQGLA